MTVKLRDLVRTYNADQGDALPAMHTTKFKLFRSMVGKREISLYADPTSTFIEPLLYLFYGRPSFRILRRSSENKDIVSPICIIVSLGALVDLKRIYPFDTGGYKKYATKVAGLLPLKAFELYSAKENAVKFALLFFANSRNYVDGGSCDKDGLRPIISKCAAAQQFVQLRECVYHADAEYDDRAFTIELQIDTPLVLNTSTVEAVVLPRQRLDEKVNDKTLETWIEDEWDAEPLCYMGSDYMEPEQYHALVKQIASGYMEKQGYVPSLTA